MFILWVNYGRYKAFTKPTFICCTNTETVAYVPLRANRHFHLDFSALNVRIVHQQKEKKMWVTAYLAMKLQSVIAF
jgi:hypothetical protein